MVSALEECCRLTRIAAASGEIDINSEAVGLRPIAITAAVNLQLRAEWYVSCKRSETLKKKAQSPP